MAKNNLPDEMRISCCNICLLAENMKDCKVCPFNVGLLYKGFAQIKTLEIPVNLSARRTEFIKQIKDSNDSLIIL